LRFPGLASAGGAAHRGYVGGKWDEIGKLQSDFMVARGLAPEHVFLDVACGSLRGGVQFIKYLDPGNYVGVEKEHTLVQRAYRRAQRLRRRVGAPARPAHDALPRALSTAASSHA
jgi:hypothetical protein